MGDVIEDPFRSARLLLSLRQSGVTHGAVLRAMEQVDRADFAPAALARLAYGDVDIPIALGQSIPSPHVIGQLLGAMGFKDAPDGRTLLVGAGSGYTAALLAQMSDRVIAVERLGGLADACETRLARLGVPRVTVRHGDGLLGQASDGPYDRAVLLGTVEAIPDGVLAAMVDGGVVVAPVRTSAGVIVRRIVGGEGVDGPPLQGHLVDLRAGVAKRL